MRARIIDNDWVMIDQVTLGIEPALVDHFSVKHPRSYFIDTSQQGWDGYYRKYDVKRQRIARPLLHELEELCKVKNFPLVVEDQRSTISGLPDPTTVGPDYLPGITLEQYQIESIQKSVTDEVGIYALQTGGGKCLGKGTPILMFDGSVKPVEDIRSGDLLMGDDSKPRRVLNTCRGLESLYRIDQKNGDSYVVNKSHILSLKRTPVGKALPNQNHLDRTIVDIPIDEYLNLKRSHKHILKGYKVPVEFEASCVPIDPYLLGVWLGDGLADDLAFSLGHDDIEIIEYLRNYSNNNGYKLIKYQDDREKADIYSIRLYEGVCRPSNIEPFTKNDLKQEFKNLGLLPANKDKLNWPSNKKHVPNIFKINSRDVRLNVLAGFIDTDGESHIGHDTINITHRRGKLINDIVFIARSLGFRVTQSDKIRCCTTTGKSDVYSSVTISGNTSRIPLKRHTKVQRQRVSKKDPLVCGITATSIGIGEYFGFEIDGNKRFLLGDFTVTHNTEVMAGIAKLFGCLTVIIAEQRVVIEQIKERLMLRDLFDVGLFYGGEMPNGQKIVVGSIQSLATPPISYKEHNPAAYAKRLEHARKFQEIVKKAELLMVDECDRATNANYRYLFKNWFHGRRKYGFSATPFDTKKPVENLILKEHIGSVIYQTDRRVLEQLGRIIPIKYFMMAMGEDGDKDDKTAFDIAEREQMIDNPMFHLKVKRIVDAFPNDGTLILVDTGNVEDLGHALEAAIPGSVFIYGKTSKVKRNNALRAFEKREIKCLIGGKILKRGLDLKGGVSNLVICGGGHLWSDYEQKIGRALRKNEKGWARVFSFLFLNNYYLYKHGRSQLKAVVEMGYETQVIFKDQKVDGAALVQARFRKPKLKK